MTTENNDAQSEYERWVVRMAQFADAAGAAGEFCHRLMLDLSDFHAWRQRLLSDVLQHGNHLAKSKPRFTDQQLKRLSAKEHDQLEQWRDRILRQLGSGKSVRMFCKDEKIPISNFTRWQARCAEIESAIGGNRVFQPKKESAEEQEIQCRKLLDDFLRSDKNLTEFAVERGLSLLQFRRRRDKIYGKPDSGKRTNAMADLTDSEIARLYPRLFDATEYQTQLLLRFRNSGLTVDEFCATERISKKQYYDWQKKLKHLLPPKTQVSVAAAKPQGTRLTHSLPPAKNVGAALAGDQTLDNPALTIRFPNGVEMKLGGDLEVIDRVLDQILDNGCP